MTSDPAAVSTASALTLLSEYTQSLDSLPADVSRQFADLRELDAVLSASVHALTTKINRLIDMIESNSSPKEQRIWLLMEIADEAQRLKLGGEDKIRVAAQVADFLKVQNENMTSLLLHIPGFNRTILSRHTSYPHISPRSYAPISMYETGRRRRGAMLGGTATDQTNPSNKRRRAVPREDDGDPVAGRTPRRDRVGDSANPRSRNGARSRRFVNLPTEVLLPAYTNKSTPFFVLPTETDPTVHLRLPNPTAPSPSRLTSQPSPHPLLCSVPQIHAIQRRGVVPVPQQHPQLQCPQATLLLWQQYRVQQRRGPRQWGSWQRRLPRGQGQDQGRFRLRADTLRMFRHTRLP